MLRHSFPARYTRACPCPWTPSAGARKETRAAQNSPQVGPVDASLAARNSKRDGEWRTLRRPGANGRRPGVASRARVRMHSITALLAPRAQFPFVRASSAHSGRAHASIARACCRHDPRPLLQQGRPAPPIHSPTCTHASCSCPSCVFCGETDDGACNVVHLRTCRAVRTGRLMLCYFFLAAVRGLLHALSPLPSAPRSGLAPTENPTPCAHRAPRRPAYSSRKKNNL